MGTTLSGFGHYVPDMVVTNAELETRLGLSAGWIERRTGVIARRYAGDGETLCHFAVKAGRMALQSAGIDPAEIGLVLLATSTPDHLLPPTSPLVAHHLGLACGTLDMAGACSGFVYALALADSFCRTQNKSVLVIAANILSRRLNFEDRASAVLFADAAGAVVVTPVDEPHRGVLGLDLVSDGSAYDFIGIPAGGSAAPFGEGTTITDTRMAMRDGKGLFIKAVAAMAGCAQTALSRANLQINAVDYVAAHQANTRMVELVAATLGVDPCKLVGSISAYGNSSAATIPLSLSMKHQQRQLTSGETVLMTAAGAGLSAGAIVMRL
ncbi:beta-ketoacyl-ACP synthase III [Rhizobium sp. CFBP 8762]|uniref:beta-ketoacyl-ACP synthase III n=1 Tax=Rhizobium sp. CFBP 8762 TaxID=2775279 RepID=UPI001781E6A8|nr:beta-ketoacyl-ACP synthase III [Rhizobium sp. CFBP 8762]MBD8554324.1 beta-ketoacyl-ACP synthase III [Rhizobium sp. CFBP 8762]